MSQTEQAKLTQDGALPVVQPWKRIVIRRIVITAEEFEDKVGSLSYSVTMDIEGRKPITIKAIDVTYYMFNGYFDALWRDMGRKFKREVAAWHR